MGECFRNVAVSAPPLSLRHCSRVVRPNHRCADNGNAQDYHDDDQSRSDCGMMISGHIQEKAACEEDCYQDKRRVEDLHCLVSRWINAAACLCSRRRDIAALIWTSAPPCGQYVSEALLRHDGWTVRARFVCQVTAHPHAPWSFKIGCSHAVWNCRAGFRHVRRAVLRADWGNSNGLRGCRHADGHSGDCREFIERKHFELLQKKLQRRSQQSSKILIIELDHSISNPISVIPSAGSVLDFALTAFKEVDRLGSYVAEAVPQSVYRNSTREEPVSVGHRKAHMLSRVRINHWGPARVTDDGHSKPQRFLAAPRKYPFCRQRFVEAERTAISKLYFVPAGRRPRKIDELQSLIEPTSADGASIIASCTVLIRGQPLVQAHALDDPGTEQAPHTIAEVWL